MEVNCINKIELSKFPFKKIRPKQKQIINVMNENWDKYKFFICEIGTGLGKSGIAINICNSHKNGFIITSTKQLQDQYTKDFSKSQSLVSIKGRKNYKCSLNEGLNCETGYCAIKPKQLIKCKQQNLCTYYNLRNKAMKSQIMLTSYQYFLRSVDCGKWMKPRNVLIFDECHLLENQIIQWAEIKLSPRDLIKKYNIINNCDMEDFIQISIPPQLSGYKENERWLKCIYKLVFVRRTEKFNEIKSILGINENDPDKLNDEQLDNIFETHKDYYELDKLYKKLDVFLTNMKINNWIIEPWEDGLQLIPITVIDLFNKYIKSMAVDKIVFMSATILDLSKFRQTFGLSKDETFLIKAESEFDPNKSPIYYKPVCKMNYNEINNNLDKITFAVNEILNNHPNEKGIIHTGNTTISKYLKDNINSDRLLVRYDNIINNDIIYEHNNSNKPTVLVSSSLSEGVDLKDDLSRFQIIIKMPWKSLTDKRIKEKIKTDNDWYTVDMFKTLIQQCGRSTRNKDDHSITYILDSSFKWWVLSNKRKGWFTSQFLQRIKW